MASLLYKRESIRLFRCLSPKLEGNQDTGSGQAWDRDRGRNTHPPAFGEKADHQRIHRKNIRQHKATPSGGRIAQKKPSVARQENQRKGRSQNDPWIYQPMKQIIPEKCHCRRSLSFLPVTHWGRREEAGNGPGKQSQAPPASTGRSVWRCAGTGHRAPHWWPADRESGRRCSRFQFRR